MLLGPPESEILKKAEGLLLAKEVGFPKHGIGFEDEMKCSSFGVVVIPMLLVVVLPSLKRLVGG